MWTPRAVALAASLVFTICLSCGCGSALNTASEDASSGSHAAGSAATKPNVDASIFYLKKREEHLRPLMLRGAKLVLQNEACLEITDGSIDERQGSAKNPTFFYTCKMDRAEPYFNFFLSRTQIEMGVIPSLPSPVSEAAATEACQQYVKSRVALPQTVDFSLLLGKQVSKGLNGNTRVTLDFTAKNATGTSLSYRAICLATTDGRLEATISRR